MQVELETSVILQAVAGDRDALEGLLRAVTPRLRGRISIQPLWRRSLDVEDIVQVSSLEAFLRIGSLRDATPAGFLAWLDRIAANNLRDAVRCLERDKRPDPRNRITRGPSGQSARTLLGSLTGHGETASSAAVLADDIDRLHKALASLPASYRTVIQRLDLEEVDVATVAEELGRSRGAVHLLRSRGHDRLKELLRERPT